VKKRRATPSTVSRAARDFERDAAKAMSDVLGVEVQRRVIGEEAQKGDLGRDLNGCQPFSVQCKHGIRIDIHGALEEAAMACDKQYVTPLAITRRVGGPALATMLLADFVKLVRGRARGSRGRRPDPPGLVQMVPPEVVPVTKRGEAHTEPSSVAGGGEVDLELQ
jgi:hypothetical protein